jgi:serine/threonine-protein kinase
VFLLKAETNKGERLGNRKFSAPEQEEGGAEAHPTMDIYALGQIMQWFATGLIHRGTYRTLIAKNLPDTETYDAIIEKCLANEPSRRFQTTNEIREFAKKLNRALRLEQRFVDPYKYLMPFSQAISATFPRLSGGAAYTEDQARLERFISMLAAHDFGTELWWTDGSGNTYFNFKKLSERSWLMGKGNNGDEVVIRSMWIYAAPSPFADLVLLNMDGMPSFSGPASVEAILDEFEDLGLVPSEEAGLVDDETYISRAEYDNGYMETTEGIVDLKGRETWLRRRHLAPHSVFIGTAFHTVLHRDSDVEIRRFLKLHPGGKEITEEQFSGLYERIRRHIHENVLRFL